VQVATFSKISGNRIIIVLSCILVRRYEHKSHIIFYVFIYTSLLPGLLSPSALAIIALRLSPNKSGSWYKLDGRALTGRLAALSIVQYIIIIVVVVIVVVATYFMLPCLCYKHYVRK